MLKRYITSYKATFPFGAGYVTRRRSERAYTHAWLVLYVRSPLGIERAERSGWSIDPDEVMIRKGFASSQILATKALAEHMPDQGFYTVKYHGVVEVTIDG